MKLTTDLINANSLHIPLADQSVQMVATSPPYFSLRSYSTGANKAHELGAENLHDCAGWATGNDCGQCYICNLRAWAREVWRVLRNDGTFWLNLGDSYAGSGGAGGDYAAGGLRDGQPKWQGTGKRNGLKPKDLCGIPQRAALALQADGWYWRSEFDWIKPNPMPSSATDRPGVAHETILMFAKSQYYYFDMDAVRVKGNPEGSHARGSGEKKLKISPYGSQSLGTLETPISGRNFRTSDPFFESMRHALAGENTVIDGGEFPAAIVCSTQAYSSGKAVDHFAAWPMALVDPLIRAGTSAAGCCPVCRAAWVRVVEKTGGNWEERKANGAPMRYGTNNNKGEKITNYGGSNSETLSWQPACQCRDLVACPGNHTLGDCLMCDNTGYAPLIPDPIPCLILDPFAGSGTSLLVARKLGRHAVGLDLSFAYLKDCARSRLSLDALADWTNGAPAQTNGHGRKPKVQPANQAVLL